MNFYDSLAQYSDRTAIITDQKEEITYAKLIEEADKMAEILSPREVIFLVCKNCKESIYAYIGALRRRVVPVMINDSINSELLKCLLDAYKPSHIIAPKNYQNIDSDFETVGVVGDYIVMKTGYKISYSINKELAMLLTTSGSTGSPKLVRQSYKNMTCNAESIASYLEIIETDRAITTMPMSYTYGLSIINSHLLKGACLIVNEYTVMNKEFWSLIKEENATTFGGVPYFYEMLKKLRFSKMELPSLKYITQAGGKLSREIAEEFSKICLEKGIKFIVMYGQTEATARMSYLPWEYALTKAGSMGIAIPGGEIYLVNEEGNLIEENETVGELIYTGDNVTLGYAENYRDLSKEDENNGVLHTGDMAKRDGDGFYYIVGRKKRFLKIFGNRINLDEVEAILRNNGFECACSGEDDLLQIYTTKENVEQDIIRFISNQTGLNPIAFKVVYIKEIPRNDSGKIMYSALS